MTRSRAESITGLQIEQVIAARGSQCTVCPIGGSQRGVLSAATFIGFWEDRPYCGGTGLTEGHAIQELVDMHFAMRGHEKAIEQGYKCARCGEMKPLQRDHIEERGIAGGKRNDRKENIRMVCDQCHRRKHGDVIPTIVPRSCVNGAFHGDFYDAGTDRQHLLVSQAIR